jgi:hypothetical protein
MKTRIVMVLLLVVGFCITSAVAGGGELYGAIHTTEGQVLTGPIRWDKNENYWDDYLDARKSEPVVVEEEGNRLTMFGVDLGRLFGSSSRTYAQFSIPFGHLRSIEVLGRNEALLTLRDGREIEIEASSSDIGSGIRGVVIDDTTQGLVELVWRDIDLVEFRQNPGADRDAERLYGTVTTDETSFTGFIVWDRDESLREDILDGERGDEEHEIPFAKIRMIEPVDDEGSRVTFASGDSLVLTGTNDVDHNHRGIIVTIPGLGSVELDYENVKRVEFDEAPASEPYGEFDGGRELAGTVQLRRGGPVSGRIVWDRDESNTWELLNGEDGHVGYNIPFTNVRSIKPLGSDASEVVLTDGRTLRLSGSNDVDADNKGLIVTKEDGTSVELGWDEIRSVEFE